MRNINICFFLCFSLLFNAIYGCGDKCDDTRDFALVAEEASINLNVLDRITMKPIVADKGAMYKKDDIKLFNENNDPINFQLIPISEDQTIFNSYQVSFWIYQEEGRMSSDEITKRAFIDFGVDRDTIDFTFRKQEKDCKGSNLKYIKIKYNGNIVAELADNNSFEITITK